MTTNAHPYKIKNIRFCKIVLFFCAFTSCTLNAQNTYSISGIIMENTTKQTLIGANVVLKNSTNITLTGTVTNASGYYVLSNIAPGNYTIEYSYIGFLTDTIKVIVKNSDVKLPVHFLKENTVQLKEFSVEAVQTKVEINGDTILYHADAFKTNPDATSEDLIKKMPGFTVEGNTVKVNGEEVKKVVVDGKTFFGDDPTATLRNLPADVVDNVQVFSMQSDQSQFTGFQDGNDEKTINLTTKKGKNVGQFGKVFAGYGSDEKYSAGITFNSFNGSQRISILGMTNNINQQNFNISDIMSVMSNSGASPGPPGSGSAMSNFFSGSQSGLTNTNAFGLNYIDSWGKFKISGNYFFNQTNNSNNSSVFREYFNENKQQYQQYSSSKNQNINHKFNVKLEYTIDSMNKITLSPRLTLQKNNSNSSLQGTNFSPLSNQLLSSTINDNSSLSNGYNFSNDLLVQHKFHKKGRTISFNLNTQLNNRSSDGNYYSTSIYEDSLDVPQIVDQQSGTSSENLILNGNLSYTEPIGKKGQMMFTYRPSYIKNEAEKTINNKLSGGEYSSQDTLLSNNFSNTFVSQRVGASYRLNTSVSSFSVGAEVEQSVLNINQSYPVTYKSDNTFLNILPSATYNYKFSKTFNVNANFRSSVKSPEVSQLQNVLDVSNPLFVKIGNPELKPVKENNLTIRLMNRSPEKEHHFFVMLSASKTDNYVSNTTYIIHSDTLVQHVSVKRGSQLTVPTNVDGYYSVRGFGVYGFPLTFIKSNLNLNFGYTLKNTPAIINSQLNHSLSNSYSGGMYLASNISANLDFSLSYNGSYNVVSNSIQSKSNNSYYNHTAGVKVNYLYRNRLVLNTDINQSQYFGLSESYNQDYMLWNAYIGYKFLKSQSLELKLSVYDILNQNKTISRTITETYSEDSNTQSLKRYALLTLTYTFKHFKAGATGPQEINLPKNMPPPPGNMPPPVGDGPPR